MKENKEIMEVVNEEVILEEVSKSGLPVAAKVAIGLVITGAVATLTVIGIKKIKKSKELIEANPEDIVNDETIIG